MDMPVVGSSIAARAASASTDPSTDPSTDAATDAPASALATLDRAAASAPLPPLTNADRAELPDRRECDFTVASFGHRSAALGDAGKRRIDAAMEKLRREGYTLRSAIIVGHIDASEVPAHDTDDADMDLLGLSRAASTRRYLVTKFKLRLENISLEDAGADHPAAAVEGQPQAALNRRVDIILKQRRRSAAHADDDQNDEDGLVICRLQRTAAVAQCV